MERTQINIRPPKDLIDKVKGRLYEEKMSLSKLIENFLYDYVSEPRLDTVQRLRKQLEELNEQIKELE